MNIVLAEDGTPIPEHTVEIAERLATEATLREANAKEKLLSRIVGVEEWVGTAE